MAKAKRRGRPPGSRNKPKVGNGKSASKMEVSQLRAYIDGLQALLAKKIQQARAALEAELSKLSDQAPRKAGSRKAVRTSKQTRAKAKPKYQSKKNPGLKWSGRGMTPVWMRDEMKGTKLKKENFLIT